MIVLKYKKGSTMEQKDKLRAWMTQKGFTQSELAQELGVTNTYICKIETGAKPLGSGFKFRFIHRFGVEEASQIFDVTQQPQGEMVTL